MDHEYITTDEAATELNVTTRRVRALIKAGRLKAKADGVGNRATYSIRRADLEAVRDRKPGRPAKLGASAPAAESKPTGKTGKGKPRARKKKG